MWTLNRVTPEKWSFLGLNYVTVHCHVISKDSRFRLVKDLRPDSFGFIDRRFQNRVRVNEVNLNQGSMKLGRVSGEFELTEFELCGSKRQGKCDQIQGKLNLVRVSGEF